MSSLAMAPRGSLAGPARRAARLVLPACVGMLLGAAAGVAATLPMEPSFRATTSVLVHPHSDDTANPLSGRRFNGVNVDTLAATARSASMVAAAARTVGTTATGLQVGVTVQPNTSVLVIHADASDAAVAADASRAVADSLIERRARQLDISSAESGQVLSQRPGRQIAPDRLVWSLNGAAAGVLLGAGAALGRRRPPSGPTASVPERTLQLAGRA